MNMQISEYFPAHHIQTFDLVLRCLQNICYLDVNTYLFFFIKLIA
jgi:hypothetical protein